MAATTAFLTGVIEGFYGRPWSHESRLAYADYLARLGLSCYLYCPKSDPYLRKAWQEDWSPGAWADLTVLAQTYRQRGLDFGLGLSPFELYKSYGAAEKKHLQAKLSRLNELNAPLLAILFDDMPGDVEDLGARQAEIVADVQAWSSASKIIVCPTYYSFDPVLEKFFGQMPDRYWPQLGEQLPADVDVFWTGNAVCSERITRADIEGIVSALGRPVVLWDNYPVNDGAIRSRHLYLEPLSDRERLPTDLVAGHFCNPMNQACLSLPALTGLSDLYSESTKDGECSKGMLRAVVGEQVLGLLQQHGAEFANLGLDEMTEQRRRELTALYEHETGDAAAEVAGWLRGEYTFDPACLTD